MKKTHQLITGTCVFEGEKLENCQSFLGFRDETRCLPHFSGGLNWTNQISLYNGPFSLWKLRLSCYFLVYIFILLLYFFIGFIKFVFLIFFPIYVHRLFIISGVQTRMASRSLAQLGRKATTARLLQSSVQRVVPATSGKLFIFVSYLINCVARNSSSISDKKNIHTSVATEAAQADKKVLFLF